MKNLYYLLLLVITGVYGQVTTTPAIPTTNKEITLLFDASNTPLSNYSGKLFAHTGVTVDGEKWQNVMGTWGDNTKQPELTKDPNNANLYRLTITPNIHDYYGVISSKTISEISIVIRSSDGNLKNGADIFIPIYSDELNIAFVYPKEGNTFSLNETITITVEATKSADLQILVDGISILNTTNANNISTAYNFTKTGTHLISAIATVNNETISKEISVFVKTTTQTIPRPNNVKNGITINGTETTFVLLAPNKNDVVLIGDFNNWKTEAAYLMHKDGDYFWVTLTDLDPSVEYAYQYLIDYEIKIADPYAEKILDPDNDKYIDNSVYPNLKSYPEGQTTGNVSTFKIDETTYAWQTQNFERPLQENLVIYEMHIRDFTEKSSYNEALLHLDYLEKLGVNAIELMPINEFEGNDSWGYNPSFYLALDKAYGTKNDFKKFVDACHERGIAVLADVVFNHSFSQSPLLQMYWDSATGKPAVDNPWYNENHNLVDNTSAHWGYDFNHTSSYTKAFFKDVLNYWLTEYKIDGYRFDFTKGFSNTIYEGANNWASTYDAERISILKEYSDFVWNTAPNNKPYVVFEHLSENSEEKELADYGILLWGNLNHSYNENTMGYGDNIDWISHQKRGWNAPHVVGYMESHDEERLMYKNLEFGKESDYHSAKDLQTALARQETAGAFLFGIPGPKMIWQFGELGYDKSINFNGRTGKKPVLWEYNTDANRKHIYDTWSTFIAFKTKHEAFSTNDFSLNTNKLLKSITLRGEEMDVIILGNFDVLDSEISINFTQTGTWFEYFSGEELMLQNTQQNIALDAGEYKMFTSKKVYDPRGGTENHDSDNDGVNDLLDECPNTIQGAEVDQNGCAIFELDKANFNIKSSSETCDGMNNGSIDISSIRSSKFSLELNNQLYDFRTELSITDLPPATYSFCIRTEEDDSFVQCFELTIDPAESLTAKTTSKNYGKKTLTTVDISSGTPPYTISINNTEIKQTYETTTTIEAKNGDQISVETARSCEGKLVENIEIQTHISVYPNPTSSMLSIFFENNADEQVSVQILNPLGKTVYEKSTTISNNVTNINIEHLTNGIYFIKTSQAPSQTIKIIKK
ncbi:alpha-amylase family glycosyl hydrolase [Flavicella marina]|uniref:alpha-amylase family glycosyl hydrolase n=1 Tax=Flavicella marina TaxID=1475951 RepID=UPI0012646E93|nr:alpha-amylase family glycosyl hydrolase [Flavicella marina]